MRLLDLLAKCGQFLFKPARQFRSRSFQQLISERKKFRRQESEMLHRMTTLLSAVVVAFVAANALNAVSPAIAQAVDRDSGAELEAAVAAPFGRVETASSPRSVTTELAALHDVTNSTKTSDRLFTAERPLYLTLIVFLASLGGALVVCGLIGGAFLYLRSMPKARRNLPPAAQRISRRHSSRAGTPGRERRQHRRVQRSVEPGFWVGSAHAAKATSAGRTRSPAIALSGNSKISSAARPIRPTIDAGLKRIAEHGSIRERSKRLRPRTDLKYPWA